MHKKELEAMGGDLDAFANQCGYANYETLKLRMAMAENHDPRITTACRKLIPCPLHKWGKNKDQWAWVYVDDCCEYHCQYWNDGKRTN